MNQTIIHSILVGGLLTASLQVEAAGFNKFDNGNGKVMSSTQFYQVLAETKPDQIAAKFGFPDQMQTIKSSTGETAGVEWIYRDAVQTASKKQDAHFMLINGEMKYVKLVNAS
jgi:hypothetical protein